MRKTGEPMATGVHALTEKEKQTLRLIVRGHDAKSLAKHLNLSVHTVNDRLRDARRKLEVSSSREAARRLLDVEGGTPEYLAGNGIGDDRGGANGNGSVMSGKERRMVRRPALFAGAAMMSIFAAIYALSPTAIGLAPSPPIAATVGSSAAVPAESAAAQAARRFLELGDQARWADAYAMTATSFRAGNSVQRWTDAALKVRAPMGALVSRTLVSDDSVPTPPSGSRAVKFRTDYAQKPGAIETLSLVNEGGAWKVSGIFVD